MSTTTVPLPKCPKTGKKSFRSEADAVGFEERNRAQYSSPRQFAYACEDCNAWHLTTSPPGNNSIAQMNYEPSAGVKKGLETDEVVRLKKSGMTVQQIADNFNVTFAAVKYHLDKAAGKVTTKTNRSAPQLMTYEQHRDRRLELEAELTKMKQQHQAAEALAQAEIDRIKQIEDRLFEARQLKIGYAPDGVLILQRYDGEFTLTAEEVKKLLAEVSPKGLRAA
jgi:hypothetical protein